MFANASPFDAPPLFPVASTSAILNPASPRDFHPSTSSSETSLLSPSLTLPSQLLATPNIFVRRGSVDPSDTLAVRRMKSAAKVRPSPTRRRSRSLEMAKSPLAGDDNCETLDSPTWLEEAKSASKVQVSTITSPEIDYIANPPIKPIFPTAHGATPSLSFAHSTPSTASSDCSSAPASYASSPATTISSPITSLGTEFISPYAKLSIRRTSEPVPSPSPVPDWTPLAAGSWSSAASSLARSSSDQGSSRSWLAVDSSSLPMIPAGGSQTDWLQSTSTRESTPSTAAPSSSTLPKSSSRVISPPSRSSRKFNGKAGIDNSRPHLPPLPSPLSTSHTPDELVPGSAGWTTVFSPGSAYGRSPVAARSSAGGEFPFPPSPSTSAFSASGTATPPLRPLNSPPTSPGPVEERLKRDFPSSSTPMGRGRSRSGHSPSPSKSPAGMKFPPAPDTHHWRPASTSVSPTRGASRPLLTPPESTGPSSRHLTSHADLAWNDLGLGRLIDYSTPPGGLDSRTPTNRQPRALEAIVGPTTGNSTSTPKDNPKRVGNEDLMGGTGGGHFGPATRDALAKVIRDHLDGVPLSMEESTIQVVEYGALNSRSASLLAPIISDLATRQQAERKAAGLSDDEGLSFEVFHADKPSSDFRPLSQQLESHSDSYLNQHWQMNHEPTLSNRVFSSFISRPFGAQILPRGSVSVGFSAMSLHWLSTERKYRTSPSTIAHGELMTFLSARAHEFKSGGLFAMAFICRSDDEERKSKMPSLHTRASCGEARSNPTTPGELPVLTRPLARERSFSSPAVPTVCKGDIWMVLSGILGKAIQRLVSTQLLKPAVARQLLALPVFPRTRLQTTSVLKAMSHAWTVESEETMMLAHPAWLGLEHNTISAASYTDHTIQLLKIFWESEMRSILREALLSRAACEWILECLFDIAREKVEEEGPQPLELEVQLVALRRR